VFQANDSNIIFHEKAIYIKTLSGRFKTSNFNHIDDDRDEEREMNEMVYLLEAKLNVKKILN